MVWKIWGWGVAFGGDCVNGDIREFWRILESFRRFSGVLIESSVVCACMLVKRLNIASM